MLFQSRFIFPALFLCLGLSQLLLFQLLLHLQNKFLIQISVFDQFSHFFVFFLHNYINLSLVLFLNIFQSCLNLSINLPQLVNLCVLGLDDFLVNSMLILAENPFFLLCEDILKLI